jgi:hypothetical protein
MKIYLHPADDVLFYCLRDEKTLNILLLRFSLRHINKVSACQIAPTSMSIECWFLLTQIAISIKLLEIERPCDNLSNSTLTLLSEAMESQSLGLLVLVTKR